MPQRVPWAVGSYDLMAESSAYYVFASSAGDGYIIAAADDGMVSPVLGFSDSGSIDADNMPDGLRWWLSQYDEEQARAAKSSGAVTTATRAVREEIAPLLATRWHQNHHTMTSASECLFT